MVFLGIDPGASGGLCVIGTHVVDAVTMPTTEKALWEFVESWGNAKGVTCVMERVHSMPKDGRSSVFKFGVSYGGLRMALVAAGIKFELVEPQVWQRYFDLLKLPDESDSAHKTRIGKYAKLRYPEAKIPRAAYDSVWIAEYARLNYPKGL